MLSLGKKDWAGPGPENKSPGWYRTGQDCKRYNLTPWGRDQSVWATLPGPLSFFFILFSLFT